VQSHREVHSSRSDDVTGDHELAHRCEPLQSSRRRPRVVIVGGGFGGLAAARALARADVDVLLIDRRNHHVFQPLLYQVATAGLNPGDITYPIRGALARQHNARVLLATATAVDPVNRQVVLEDGALAYDYLVVATGATHSYFGQDQWAAAAPGLKSVEDALDIRRRVFLAYEAAERETDPAAQRDWLTFAVVGAGPTGVELAGALGELGLETLANDFRAIDPRQVRVVLFEGRDRILLSFPPRLSAAAQRALERRRVQVRLNARVVAIDGAGVTVHIDGRDERIGARTVLWAAGVCASPLGASLGARCDASGRVEVLPDLSVPGHPEVFAIGDLARVAQRDGSSVPGVAQGALQAGRHVAALIAAEVDRSGVRRGAPRGPSPVPGAPPPRPAFHYRSRGNLATIGRADAVVATRYFAHHGLLAWVLWWVIHIFFLIGYRNRILTLFHWAWSWLTFQRSARLITGPIGRLPPIALER
jgi:NADH dehydrogenase